MTFANGKWPFLRCPSLPQAHRKLESVIAHTINPLFQRPSFAYAPNYKLCVVILQYAIKLARAFGAQPSGRRC